MIKKVYVGMSGGVDSSLSAALLVKQGYSVTGVYMKNWTSDLPGLICPWREDYMDAKRVAVNLGIPLISFDFEKDYKHKVIDYMLDAYKQGLTPNPDIVCNQEIKFKLFLETAQEHGADLIATGHYARTSNGQLQTGLDKNKDQSYFLYRVSSDALKRTLFPIGHLNKSQVRAQAATLKLVTANKPDSQGICFVGEVGIQDFLKAYLGEQPSGKIIDQKGVVIGEHDGAIFYTIGQRHGLRVGGGLPYYVTGKDMKKNIVYVSSDLDDKRLWSKTIKLTELWWINEPPIIGKTYQLKCRYRSAPVSGKFSGASTIDFSEEIRAVSPGQSAVVYDGELVLGGGVVVSSS